MAVAHDYRIPHSEFLSWKQRDRDKAIWYHLRERQRCSGCGTHPDEWDPAEGGSIHAYRVKEHFCPGCQLLEPARKQLHSDSAPAGLTMGLSRS